jgi:hypothetical protein
VSASGNWLGSVCTLDWGTVFPSRSPQWKSYATDDTEACHADIPLPPLPVLRVCVIKTQILRVILTGVGVGRSSFDFMSATNSMADPSGRAVKGVGLRPLACWDCGFESSRGRGCLSLVSVVCCQVEVSAWGRSLVWRSPTECGVSDCDREASIRRGPDPLGACCAMEETISMI